MPDSPRPSNTPPTPVGGGRVTAHPLAVGAGAGLSPDPRVIALLQASLAVMAPRASELAHDFYARLFAACPHLRGMFSQDMSTQEKKLIESLVAVVEGLREPQAVRNKLLELGRTHAGKGARPEHYPVVCKMMLASMKHVSGSAWTQTLETEWARALEMISQIMLVGAATSRA